jgi:hypothetical protein
MVAEKGEKTILRKRKEKINQRKEKINQRKDKNKSI